jgi:hypothetical protein
MKTKFNRILFAFSLMMVSGCANMSVGEQLGYSTLACTGVGTIVGLATGEAGSGAIAGGGCLALASIYIAYNYFDKQSRTVEQDEERYGYSLRNVTEPMVRIRSAKTTPSRVRRGQKASIVTDYSVITPKDQQNLDVEVEESVVLTSKSDGGSKPFEPRSTLRKAGGWKSTLEFKVPDQLPPGTYEVEHKVKAGNSYAVEKSSFRVTSKS